MLELETMTGKEKKYLFLTSLRRRYVATILSYLVKDFQQNELAPGLINNNKWR
jgi:hypothetical protein